MYKTLWGRKTLRICPFFQGVYNLLGKRIEVEISCNWSTKCYDTIRIVVSGRRIGRTLNRSCFFTSLSEHLYAPLPFAYLELYRPYPWDQILLDLRQSLNIAGNTCLGNCPRQFWGFWPNGQPCHIVKLPVFLGKRGGPSISQITNLEYQKKLARRGGFWANSSKNKYNFNDCITDGGQRKRRKKGHPRKKEMVRIKVQRWTHVFSQVYKGTQVNSIPVGNTKVGTASFRRLVSLLVKVRYSYRVGIQTHILWVKKTKTRELI